MKFESLKDKCEYFRKLTDYRLMPNGYVLIMIDGRSFSKLIKNKYRKPFDNKFINMMNKVAEYVCSQVQGIKFAYVQSDEISFLLTDFDTPNTDSFFGLRLSKLQSIIASMAAAKFNQLVTLNYLDDYIDASIDKVSIKDFVSKSQLVQFDCKVWNVPNENEVYAWFLYRNIDCIRNSKQQTAQTWCSHKELMGKNTDEQIVLLRQKHNIDWNEFNEGEKYGRFIYKVKELYHNDKMNVDYERSVWKTFNAFPLSEEGNRNKFLGIIEND